VRRLVVLGNGLAGQAVARIARDRDVLLTSRRADRPGITQLPIYDAASIASICAGADVVVTFPPDGRTDARIAPGLAKARAVVYLSSTGVYGAATGRVDELTPVDPEAPRAGLRLQAEEIYRERGGIILRAAGIYGPERGLHLRLLRGEHRLPGRGENVVSRIHVDDLAMLALASLEQAEHGAIFDCADDAPVPQREVVTWLCARLSLPLPPSVDALSVDLSLRGDRAIDGSKIQHALGVKLAFPSYREGFADCLARMPR
jgi:nucleoside-diphosphate-sugar epimerase